MKPFIVLAVCVLLAGCVTTSPNQPRQHGPALRNEKAVQSVIDHFYAAYAHADQETVLSLIAPDALITTFENNKPVTLRKQDFAATLARKLNRLQALNVKITPRIDHLALSDANTAEAKVTLRFTTDTTEDTLTETLVLKRQDAAWLIDRRSFQ